MLRSSPVNLFLRLNTSLWELRDMRSMRSYGAFCIGWCVVAQTACSLLTPSFSAIARNSS